MKHRKVISSSVTSGYQSRSGSLSPCENDYLKETPKLMSLGDDIRKEIERRFRRSRVNATYVFPRVIKTTAAPLPPSGLDPDLIRTIPKVKSSKSINSSLNSSFTKLNESHSSLNVSRTRTPSHSRNVSLTKLLPKSLLISKPRLVRLIKSPYVNAGPVSRPSSKAGRTKKPGRTPVSKSFLTQERGF